ncbi:MAG: excinuclease ABC subunit C, partial [Bacteroidota bacterium]|nr:excinuclease ABC subunit C [Bacteroidota bacterium]
KRSADFLKNELNELPGIGKITLDTLLQKFRSMKKIREAKIDEIASLVGPSKAKVIFDYFHKSV